MQVDMVGFDRGGTRRAARYAITAPLRFRADGGVWRDGITVNISARGLLFRTVHATSVCRAVEMRIALPTDRPPAGAHIACSGRVVRITEAPHDGEMLVAVAIDQGHVRPSPGNPS